MHHFFIAKLEEAQGYWQQGKEEVQGTVPYAQHWLRNQQEDQARWARRIHQGPRPQPPGLCKNYLLLMVL